MINLKKITNQPAWVYSLFFHVFFLSVLALCGLPTNNAESSLSFSLAFHEERLEEEVSVIEIEQVEFTEETGSVDTQVDVPIEKMELEVKTPDYIPEDEMVSFLLEDTTDNVIRLESSSQTSSPVETEHPGMALASGTGTGEGSGGDGDGVGVHFFGVKSEGNSFVLVLDASSSMNEKRFAATKNEAVKFLMNLPLHRDVKFKVMFFNTDIREMDSYGLKEVSEVEKWKTISWITAWKEGGGQTYPASALERALELNPHVVYFLTDGEFDPDIVDQVTASNAGRIKIYTIGLDVPVGSTADLVLRKLASQNGGKSRNINR